VVLSPILALGWSELLRLLSVKLAAPEPEVLKLLGKKSERNRTSALNSREIDKIIRKARSQKSKQ